MGILRRKGGHRKSVCVVGKAQLWDVNASVATLVHVMQSETI